MSTATKLTTLALAVSVALIGSMPVQAADAVSAPVAQTANSNFLSTISWDAEYDVVVLGYGLAGGAAAIAAADQGAKVLLSEKAPYGQEGGNSKYSAQRAIYVQPDYPDDKALKYMQLLRGDYKNPTDETLKAFIKGAKNQLEYIKSLGAEKPHITKNAEYPDFEGSDGYGNVLAFLPGGDASLYHLVQKNVKDRADKVDVWFDSPGKKLIQDPKTGIVHGVMIEVEGQPKYVRAKNGVVLATGGYENNPDMYRSIASQDKVYPKASHYNTGDGILMGMDVKANMVNMAANNGPDPNVINPETGGTYGFLVTSSVDFPVSKRCFTHHNVIIVAGDGKRFMNEAGKSYHGRIKYHNDYFYLQMPDPAFMIFDENGRTASKVYSSWSEGSVEEIESGLVKKADTLEELAGILGIDPKGLVDQVAKYNQYCAAGSDPEFGRMAERMKPVEKGPFYGVQLHATYTNTHAGPEHDEIGAIRDRDGKRIPHLYGAGELGSMFSNKYTGAGNVGEALIFGNIAGAEAAKVKDDTDQGSVLQGKTPFNHVAPEPVYKLEPGEKLGKAMGMGGELVLAVKADGGKITSIRILQNFETPGIGTKATKTLPDQMVKTGKMDNYAGASVSSNAIKKAIDDALSK